MIPGLPSKPSISTRIWLMVCSRFVAAMVMIPGLPSKPSISTRIWLMVCSRSSLPPPLAAAALPGHGVDLVDEDDAGRVLLGLAEDVADAGGADAHEHLDELGAGNRDEGDAGFPGHGLG